MAGRGRTSFQKRQKEQLRLEKRQAKAARKEDRKTNPGQDGASFIIEREEIDPNLDRMPLEEIEGLGKE